MKPEERDKLATILEKISNDNQVRIFSPNKFAIALNIANIATIFTIGAGAALFYYTVRDSMRENMEANNKNHAEEVSVSRENIAMQKKMICFLTWHIFEGRPPNKRECEKDSY